MTVEKNCTSTKSKLVNLLEKEKSKFSELNGLFEEVKAEQNEMKKVHFLVKQDIIFDLSK